MLACEQLLDRCPGLRRRFSHRGPRRRRPPLSTDGPATVSRPATSAARAHLLGMAQTGLGWLAVQPRRRVAYAGLGLGGPGPLQQDSYASLGTRRIDCRRLNQRSETLLQLLDRRSRRFFAPPRCELISTSGDIDELLDHDLSASLRNVRADDVIRGPDDVTFSRREKVPQADRNKEPLRSSPLRPNPRMVVVTDRESDERSRNVSHCENLSWLDTLAAGKTRQGHAKERGAIDSNGSKACAAVNPHNGGLSGRR